MRRIASLAVFFACASLAHAEIYKLAVPSDRGMTFVWWPVLPKLPGWSHDEQASRGFAVNMLIPNGKTFESAAAVIYAKANFKPRTPDTRSVADLIRQDVDERKVAVRGVTVAERAPLHTADGNVLRLLEFSPLGSGAWERVAFGEEGEYFLLFVVSAQTKQALQSTRPVFESIVSRYSERPNNSLGRSRDR